VSAATVIQSDRSRVPDRTGSGLQDLVPFWFQTGSKLLVGRSARKQGSYAQLRASGGGPGQPSRNLKSAGGDPMRVRVPPCPKLNRLHSVMNGAFLMSLVYQWSQFGHKLLGLVTAGPGGQRSAELAGRLIPMPPSSWSHRLVTIEQPHRGTRQGGGGRPAIDAIGAMLSEACDRRPRRLHRAPPRRHGCRGPW
jgi:hypothetical protein